MNSRTRGGFYMLWTIAILICLAVCVFLLIWVSFTDGGAAQTPPAADQLQQDGTQPGAEGQDGTQPDAEVQDGTQPADGQQDQDGTQSADGQEQQPVLPGEDTAAGQSAPQQTTAAGDAAAASSVTLGQTADAGMDYLNRLIFLGDSTTYGMYAYEVLPHYQVWTPASGTMSLFNYAVETIDYYTPGGGTSSQAMPIVDCVSASQPEYLVITLGLNGVAMLNEEQFKGYYTSLIQDVLYASPNTRIICNSIYPVIDAQTSGDIKNDRINAANGWIMEVAAQMGARYLNSREALADESGSLSTQYIGENGDGIHMNANGYNAVLQYVRTHAWQ